MNFSKITLLLAATVLAGCVHDSTAVRGTATPRHRVTYTGSHIPQPRNQVTASPVSATTPSESVSRHPDSLVPTEPVVGATNNAPGQDTGPEGSH